MNSLLLLWVFIVQKTAGNKPLILIHDTVTNINTIADFEVIRHNTFSSFARNPSIFVFLCPAETEEQRNLKVRVNGHKRSGIMFIENAVRNIEKIQSLNCLNTLQPFLVKSSENNLLVGYPIYTKNNLNSETEFIKTLNSNQENVYWYPLLEIKLYNKDPLRTASVKHVLYAEMSTNNYSKKCVNYDFGQDILGGIEIYKFYLKENQNELFNNFNVSIFRAYGYFTMHQMAPIQDNINSVVEAGLCTYFNTTPLWQSVSEGPVRKVEQFIRRVADILGYIAVETRVIGKLELVSDERNILTEVSLETPLYKHKKIPVSKILSKVLTYSVEFLNQIIVNYYVDIIIHNQPTMQISEEDEMCTSVCEDLGWNFGIVDGHIGLTYCCLSSGTSGLNMRPFNLSDVPIKLSNGNIKQINVIDALKNPNKNIFT